MPHENKNGLVQGVVAYVQRGRRGSRGRTVAAVDLGTNNCRLLIARPQGEGFQVVDAFSRIVRLGEGVGHNCQLSDSAMTRAVAALKVCARKIERAGAAPIRAVATEACRRADNADRFVARVAAETGLPLEIIDTAEEARLALVGCASLYQATDGYALLFDIGGGSTQITWLTLAAPAQPNMPAMYEVIDYISIPCGVVTLSERFGAIEKMDAKVCRDTYDRVLSYVNEMLAPFEERHGISRHVASGRVQMVGTSGTVTTLAGVFLDLPRYDRSCVDGRRLSFAELAAARDQILSLDRQGRAAQPCIGGQRADLVVAGCAVLDAICALWPVGELRVADRGLREGILHGLMAGAADSQAAG